MDAEKADVFVAAVLHTVAHTILHAYR